MIKNRIEALERHEADICGAGAALMSSVEAEPIPAALLALAEQLQGQIDAHRLSETDTDNIAVTVCQASA